MTSGTTEDLLAIVDGAIGEPAQASHLALALSGGRDSMTLLHLLASGPHRARLGAVHVNHGLSPQADEWQELCRRACARLGVAFASERLERRAVGRANLEANARRLRYRALYRHTKAPGLLLTAHHLDDQAETYLGRHLRGVGLYGAGAMAISSPTPLPGVRLLRPLLSVPSSAIEAYARAHGIEWIEDPLNQDLRLERNWIRHRLVPLLRERHPRISAILARNAQLLQASRQLCVDIARADHQILHSPIPAEAKLYRLAPRRPPGQGAGAPTGDWPQWPRWELGRLLGLAPYRLDNLLYCLLRACQGEPPRAGIIDGLRQWLHAGSQGYRLHRIGRIAFRRWRGWVYVDDWRSEDLSLAELGWEQWRDAGDEGLPSMGSLPGPTRAAIEADGRQIGLRARQGGDAITLDGKRRRLKSLLLQHAIEPWLRGRVPVVCLDGEPVAVALPQRWLIADGLR